MGECVREVHNTKEMSKEISNGISNNKSLKKDLRGTFGERGGKRDSKYERVVKDFLIYATHDCRKMFENYLPERQLVIGNNFQKFEIFNKRTFTLYITSWWSQKVKRKLTPRQIGGG